MEDNIIEEAMQNLVKTVGQMGWKLSDKEKTIAASTFNEEMLKFGANRRINVNYFKSRAIDR